MLSSLADYLPENKSEERINGNSSEPSETKEAVSADGRPIHLPGDELYQRLKDWITSDNIIMEEGFDESRLGALGMLVTQEYEIDDNSRSDWIEQNRVAIDLAMQVAVEKNYPWPKASNVIYPLITVASIQFAARAYPAIVAGRNVVKGVVVGNDEGVPLPPPQTPGTPLPPGLGASPTVMPSSGGGALMGSTAMTPPPGPMPPQMGDNGVPPLQQWAVPPGAKAHLANLIGDHMSWQLLDEQEEWEPEMDTLLHVLPIVGCEFKKTYFDPDKKRNASVRVPAQNVVINYRAKSMDRAPRITEEVEYYPLEIDELVDSGLWLDFEGLRSTDDDGDKDAPVKFLEQHRWYDLDDDGLREPYIVTVHKQTSKVVRIVARYDEAGIHWNATQGKIQKIEAVQYYTKFDFLPNPDGAIYGVGFGQLLRPLNEAINSTLNMLLDAGHLANTQGGFIGKGLNMNSGSLRFQPGEYKLINAPGGAVRDAIVKMEFPGPSAVLFNLLGMLVEAGKEIAAVKDVLTGEQQQGNVPATTTLALIEQGLKVFSAIYKRIHRALKAEYAKLYRLNKLYLEKDAQFKAGDAWKTISQEDYEHGDGVEPYSDPTMVSDMQKLGRAQFLMNFANDPLMNKRKIFERTFAAASIDKAEELFAPAPAPNPAIIAKAAELHTKQTEVEATAMLRKAQSMEAIAAAVASIAMAEKTSAGIDDMQAKNHIAFMNQQLDAYRAQLEGQGDPGDGETPATPDAPPPPPSAGGPGHTPPPPIAAAMPPAATPPDQGEPVQGVQQDRDGHVYMPDLKGHHP